MPTTPVADARAVLRGFVGRQRPTLRDLEPERFLPLAVTSQLPAGFIAGPRPPAGAASSPSSTSTGASATPATTVTKDAPPAKASGAHILSLGAAALLLL